MSLPGAGLRASSPFARYLPSINMTKGVVGHKKPLQIIKISGRMAGRTLYWVLNYQVSVRLQNARIQQLPNLFRLPYTFHKRILTNATPRVRY